jgi:hypothetical protein
MELAFANARSVPAWLALRRPILPTSPFLKSFRFADYSGVMRTSHKTTGLVELETVGFQEILRLLRNPQLCLYNFDQSSM